jgi:hypothetical protein
VGVTQIRWLIAAASCLLLIVAREFYECIDPQRRQPQLRLEGTNHESSRSA